MRNLKAKVKRKHVLPLAVFFTLCLGMGIVIGYILSQTITYNWTVSSDYPITIVKTTSPGTTLFVNNWYNNSFAYQIDNMDEDNSYDIDIIFIIQATGVTPSDVTIEHNYVTDSGTITELLTFVQDGADQINATIQKTLDPYGDFVDDYADCDLRVKFASSAPAVGWSLSIHCDGDINPP